MTQEEKARRYDEALERARKCLDEKRDTCFVRPDIIFPELKESEEEMVEEIRKDIIKYLNNRQIKSIIESIATGKWIDWIKEQGEKPKKVSIWKHWKDGIAGNGEGEQIYLIKIGNTYNLSSCLGFECDYIELSELDKLTREEKQVPKTTLDKIIEEEVDAWIKKQNSKPQGKTALEVIHEEKVDNANKVEPKFKVGDWITFYDGKPFKILKVESEQNGILNYLLLSQNGHDSYYNKKYVDENARLWTIQDAKDGDVLAYVTDEDDLWIMIYRSLYKPYEGHVHYHALLVNDDFSDKGTCCICINDLKPATKEQRDLLFQKMKEAGYEWDAGKRELKKIEQKSVNKVEPKFKVGDWITNDYCKCKITFIDSRYWYSETGVLGNVIDIDKTFHLWTIKDAKDGDVLVHNDCIFIFMEIKDGIVKGICTELSDTISNFGKLEYNNDYCPATKEQRDALMRVINDSGYEWDSEKKVLKKIEQQSEKSKWTEEDEKNWLGIMDEIEANKSNAPDYDIETYDRYLCWLESLKQRIL